MIRVEDWKLCRKTDFIRQQVQDSYIFPPFHHITLYGPFFLKNEQNADTICSAIESACRGKPGFILRLSGWVLMRGRKGLAIAHDVIPSPGFREFYDRLWHSLSPVTRSLSWIDQDPLQRRFHITHSYNMRTRDAESVCEIIRKTIKSTKNEESAISMEPVGPSDKNAAVLCPEYVPFTVMRVALLENGSIRREFDMPSGTWLPRALAYRREKTAVSLRQYRHLSGIELVKSPEPSEEPPFVTSDLHLGHENIIRYCRRPFSSAAEMDEVLINNWNRIVREGEEVLFLGDLRYGPGAAPAGEYLSRLRGRITCIRGNHDEDIPHPVPFIRRRVGGMDFLFIHNPVDIPPDFEGWTVHGHSHNNNIKEYPFIDFVRKRVNVSTEMTGYRPVSLHTILGYLQDGSRREKIDLMPGSPPDKSE
jgi:calcineurin-like phosphoesterase family protein